VLEASALGSGETNFFSLSGAVEIEKHNFPSHIGRMYEDLWSRMKKSFGFFHLNGGALKKYQRAGSTLLCKSEERKIQFRKPTQKLFSGNPNGQLKKWIAEPLKWMETFVIDAPLPV